MPRLSGIEAYTQEDVERYIIILQEIGRRALAQVAETFGSGVDVDAVMDGDMSSAVNPPSKYAFHSLLHSLNVGTTAEILAVEAQLSPLLVALAKAAGYAHDVIREGTLDGNDERESAEWFVETAAELGLPPELQEMGRLAILGTVPTLDGYVLVGQKVSELSFEDAPPDAELIARIVASADLGELLKPSGPLASHLLLYEIANKSTSDDAPHIIPDIDRIKSFQKDQIKMLETYKHPLQGSELEHLLTSHKQEVLNYTKEILAKLDRGEITTWEQLIEADIAFLQSQQ